MERGQVLIVDAGGTSTSWALLSGDNADMQTARTDGLNMTTCSPQHFTKVLTEAERQGVLNVEKIYFYGAGCLREVQDRVREQFLKFPATRDCEVHVADDMTGAAIALFGNQEGIAAILGTGSNSCLWNGEKIVEQVRPLGFILGDEGSGAALGKRFLRHLLRGELSPEIEQIFWEETGLNYASIIENIYREAKPNKYLGQFTRFLKERISDSQIGELVTAEFDSFFQNMASRYDKSPQYPISFIGSVAFHFEKQLRQAAENASMQIGKIELSPMDGLIRYHSQNIKKDK